MLSRQRQYDAPRLHSQAQSNSVPYGDDHDRFAQLVAALRDKVIPVQIIRLSRSLFISPKTRYVFAHLQKIVDSICYNYVHIQGLSLGLGGSNIFSHTTTF